MSGRTRLSLIAAVALVAALAGLRWLDVHPITLRGFPDEPRAPGAVPARSPSGSHRPVALVVDSRRVAESAAKGSFAALDLSFGWLGPLEQEFGAVDVIDLANQILPQDLRSLVVVTASADGADIRDAEPLAFHGATVFVDAPQDGAPWTSERLDVANLHAGSPAALPCPAGDLIPESAAIAPEDRAALAAAPWPRPDHVSALSIGSGGRTRTLSSTKPHLFFERTLGSGRVVSSAISLGRVFATMLQGTATGDDFTLGERHGDYPDIVEPDDLVADPGLRENESPFADVLMHAVAALLDPPADSDLLPVPRVAWFPSGSRGVFLMTHDEDLRGGAAMVALAEQDRAAGIRSTHFVVTHPRLAGGPGEWPEDARHAAAIRAAGGALALHSWLLPTPRGFAKIEPVQWVAPIADQLAWFGRIGPTDEERRVNRNHMLQLRPHWSDTFRILAASGFALDSTFGANKGRGYLFGSARPYPLLDSNGLPLPVRELPFQSQEDWGGADAAFFDRLFAANAERHRGALVSIFHPSSVLRTPTDPALVQHVRAAALASGHVSLTMGEFLEFQAARRAVSLACSRSDAGPRELRVEVDSPEDGLALLVPLGPKDAFDLVSYDPGVSAPAGVRETIAGHPFLNLPLRAGLQRFGVRFRRN